MGPSAGSRWVVALLLCAVPAACAAPKPEKPVEEYYPDYRPIGELAGNVSCVGSDSMNNMVALWSEGFRKHYPGVFVSAEGKGAATAIPAMIRGTAQIGTMSREPKPIEQDKFEKEFGYRATVLRVALSALAIYVHKDNPLDEITLEQIDAIFSTSRKRGYKEDIATWGQLGLKGEWADRPINRYGRNSASGMYGFMKDVALLGGDFKDTTKEWPGSATVVLAITDDRDSIGYSGIGYGTSDVKRLKIAEKSGGTFVAAEAENVRNNSYPLRRFLFVVINKAPGRPVSPIIREFCTYILSKPGQACVAMDGHIPLTVGTVHEQLKKLGIEK